MTTEPRILVPAERIEAFCRAWGVREFSLYGSVLRDDFLPGSDVNVMLEFAAGCGFTFENTPALVAELEALYGRRVQVVEKCRITNRHLRESIMAGRRVLYAA